MKLKACGFLTCVLVAATLVACGSSNSEKIATSGPSVSRDQTTAEQLVTNEPFNTSGAQSSPFVPISVHGQSDPNQPGYQKITVDFALVNASADPLNIGILGQPGSGTLSTVDSYSYSTNADSPISFFTDAAYGIPILPEGFAARFLAGDSYYYGQVSNPKLLSYSFDVPDTAGQVEKLVVDGLPEINLLHDVQENVHFPTDRPDSDFLSLDGASLSLPQPQNSDGAVESITLSQVTPVTDLNYIDADNPYKLYSVSLTAQNMSRGYKSTPAGSLFDDAFLVADDGGVYVGKFTYQLYTAEAGGWTIPFIDRERFNLSDVTNYSVNTRTAINDELAPGASTQFKVGIAVAKGVTSAKLVLPAAGFAIINVRLSP